jgi:hypothetical protein
MNETLPHKPLHKATLLLLAAGVGLHLATALFFGSGNAGFRAGLCAWSLTPYLLLALMRRRKIRGIGVFLGALAALLTDASAFWAVFVAPRHSTAALLLLAAPLWNLFCVTPLALAAETYFGGKP